MKVDPEKVKRRRERRVAYAITLVFIVSTILQAVLSNKKESYGFVQSLLFFGLVHLNVIIIMFLVFLVSRNLVKAYIVWRAGALGSSLRWKLVTSLLAFSILPSILLFAGSSYVIRQGFDRWFSGQVYKALEDAQAITEVHYNGLQSNIEFFSKQISQSIQDSGQKNFQIADVKKWAAQFPVQAVELYSDLLNQPLRALTKDVREWMVPRASVESLERAFRGESFDLIRQFGDGDLVQKYLLIKSSDRSSDKKWVLVLSQNVPLGLKTRIGDLRQAFSGYQQTLLLRSDLKTNYTLVLLTLFVLILFVVSWFGLFIAKSVTDPVLELMEATQAFGKGEWNYRIQSAVPAEQAKFKGGFGADLEVLKSAFNTMAEEVGHRGKKLEEANVQLRSFVRELEERERYLEILLGSIRRGVLVIDPKGRISRINSEAVDFSSYPDSEIHDSHQNVGREWRDVFVSLGAHEDAKAWLERASVLGGRSIDKVFEITVGEKSSHPKMKSVRATAIGLFDDLQENLGTLIILEDVTDAARIEKLAAWQEVAKRVAHEIKNPLTPIQISADRLHRRFGEQMARNFEDGPVFEECIFQIQKQVRVIRDLVREFSQFAKLPEPQFKVMNILPLIEKIVADYRFTHPTVEFKILKIDSSSDQLFVKLDPEYMRRMIVNLADNALHSMDEAKVLHPAFHIVIGTLPLQDNFIQIVFEDNGPGIPATLREKIFDPYVTSKASGLGLGLPIVRRIALEHSGRIRCEESARGARFVLEIPRILDSQLFER